MVSNENISYLREIVSEDQIEDTMDQYHPLGNSGEITVYPKTEQEISNLLKYANSLHQKISVMGGGTKRGFGGVTEKENILLSLREYKGIVEHSPGDMILTVKAGTPFQEIQNFLAKSNQRISIDPAWPDDSTIGGVVAANDSGPKRLRYGAARDSVIGLRVVYPNGSVIRTGGKVVKNVAGYDMNKLFIGSMGTLGVLSEITLKLRPLPKYESLLLLSFPKGDLEEIKSFAVCLLDSFIELVSLEMLNPGLSEKLTGNNCLTVAISLEDVQSSVLYQEEAIQKMKPETGEIEILKKEEAQQFWNRFYQIGPNGAIESSSEEITAALKIGVVNLDILSVIQECELLKDSHNLSIEAHGGLGHGLGQVVIRGAENDVVSAISNIRAFVSDRRGYAIVTHLPLSLRREINVWGESPPYFFLMEGIKSKIDPNRILNPKRFVGGI